MTTFLKRIKASRARPTAMSILSLFREKQQTMTQILLKIKIFKLTTPTPELLNSPIILVADRKEFQEEGPGL